MEEKYDEEDISASFFMLTSAHSTFPRTRLVYWTTYGIDVYY